MNLGQAVRTFVDRVFGLIITISPVEIKKTKKEENQRNQSLYMPLKAVYATKNFNLVVLHTHITDLDYFYG